MSLQSCPTLCDPIDGRPPGSPIPEILQARTLEWVAISFSNAWKWKVKGKSFSRVRLLATPWTAAYQAPLSMGFSRQEYWSGVPLAKLISFRCMDAPNPKIPWDVCKQRQKGTTENQHQQIRHASPLIFYLHDPITLYPLLSIGQYHNIGRWLTLGRVCSSWQWI